MTTPAALTQHASPGQVWPRRWVLTPFFLSVFLSLLQVTKALAQVTVPTKTSLPAATYTFLFPVLQALLSPHSITPLHDAALSVVSLHVQPGQDVPRADTLHLMYHLLSVIPTYRERVLPLLQVRVCDAWLLEYVVNLTVCQWLTKQIVGFKPRSV